MIRFERAWSSLPGQKKKKKQNFLLVFFFFLNSALAEFSQRHESDGFGGMNLIQDGGVKEGTSTFGKKNPALSH